MRELELVCAPLKTDAIPGQIDIELALDKTRELYELMAKHLNEIPEPLPEVQPVIKETSTKEIRKATPFIDVTKTPVSQPVAPSKHNITEMSTEESGEISPGEETLQVMTSQETEEPPLRKTNKEQEKTIIGEKFIKSEKSFVNENMGKIKGGKSLTTKHQSKPITNLQASIGINEKFLFIKELFKGNSDYYSKSIDFLNQAGSYDNAMQYIHENFQWDKENDATKKFLDLVHRKFQK